MRFHAVLAEQLSYFLFAPAGNENSTPVDININLGHLPRRIDYHRQNHAGFLEQKRIKPTLDFVAMIKSNC